MRVRDWPDFSLRPDPHPNPSPTGRGARCSSPSPSGRRWRAAPDEGAGLAGLLAAAEPSPQPLSRRERGSMQHQSSKASSCTLSRPQSLNFPRVHALALASGTGTRFRLTSIPPAPPRRGRSLDASPRAAHVGGRPGPSPIRHLRRVARQRNLHDPDQPGQQRVRRHRQTQLVNRTEAAPGPERLPLRPDASHGLPRHRGRLTQERESRIAPAAVPFALLVPIRPANARRGWGTGDEPPRGHSPLPDFRDRRRMRHQRNRP